MKPDKNILDKNIVAFLSLVNDCPKIFTLEAWQDLPNLATEIANLPENESAIVDTIKNWCLDRDLGDELRDSLREVTPGKPIQGTLEPLENLTKTIPDIIMDAYKQAQKPGAITTADTSDESR